MSRVTIEVGGALAIVGAMSLITTVILSIVAVNISLAGTCTEEKKRSAAYTFAWASALTFGVLGALSIAGLVIAIVV